ncbi:MAG: BT_3928 family protein [Chitinophagaceae bacterium]
MKVLVNIARVIVGLLFIFSGLVKANDPLGLSYKMQEFFDLWGMTRFNSWTLLMSVLMNAFEIIAGFALLLGWRIRLFSWLLLLLIIFFTFLTGYAFLSGKFRSCGCFGDCLPITPKTSFIKDLALLLLICFLFWKRHFIERIFPGRATTSVMFGITILSFGFQWYTLSYLPVADCLPFKKGNNISEKMKSPAGSRPDSFAILFVYEREGKQYEFSPAELPADLATYKFISRKDKLVKKGNAEPPIRGFLLSGITDEDSTQVILSQPYAVLLFCEDFSVPVSKWEKSFTGVYATAAAKNIPVYMITTQPAEAVKMVAGKPFSAMQVLKCDFTVIRTAARTNPCLYILKEGTITGKWSRHNFSTAAKLLKELPPQTVVAELPAQPIPGNQ